MKMIVKNLEFSETLKKDEVVYGRGGVSFNSYVSLDKDIDIDLDADVNKDFDIDTENKEPENEEPDWPPLCPPPDWLSLEHLPLSAEAISVIG